MKIDNNVPFYSNTPDDTHCFQAALKMILKYFQSEKDFSWEELEKMTAKVEGLWTWATAGVLWMQKNGFDVKNIESFDYHLFIEKGGEYLVEEFGEEMGVAQIKNSDISQEQKLAKEYLENIIVKKRVPIINDLKKFLEDGYLIICNVNSQALNQNIGYCGHSIVIKGIEDDKLIIHDPGLPPLENRHVSFDVFESAWAYPNEKAKNIIAFKLKNNKNVQQH
ncbi:MAG: hypothetical protein ACD_9C00265G0003 [uncultured bacterium]|nr:MAG: hypothetical protein ACD_9C00265G0003 [uncultured bacterium]